MSDDNIIQIFENVFARLPGMLATMESNQNMREALKALLDARRTHLAEIETVLRILTSTVTSADRAPVLDHLNSLVRQLHEFPVAYGTLVGAVLSPRPQPAPAEPDAATDPPW